jgi:pyruvate dehydrogenase E2 component (dihydrolipoamide acetyltransferase)
MEEGTILRWLKRDGEHVARGEELVEIETDKASMTYESDQDGELEIVAGEGDTLAIGQIIARVGMAGERSPATSAPAGESAPPQAPSRATDADGRASESPLGVPPTASRATSHDGGAARAVGAAGAERVKASPLARRIAREAGVALEGLTGSGPGGRIVRADVEGAQRREPASADASGVAASALEQPEPTAQPAPSAVRPAAATGGVGTSPAPVDVMTAKGETTEHELTRTQQLIARRMAESKATIPHFTLEAEIDMEQCVGLRKELAKAAAANAAVPTYNDMVVKSCALALREHQRVNASYRDARMQLHSRVNVGVAVAVEPDDPLQGSLVVPTVFDADIKSLGEVARETRALAERVRSGAITPPELSGGTFTVSNLGMYGVRSFAAIINPPQVAILSVGSLAARAVVRDDAIVARNTMAVTLACDHRVLYGADAARFLARVRDLLEQPAALNL